MAYQNYATLSNCWGKAEMFCLTKNSDAKLTEGVDQSALPLTFRNAVDAARFLGLRYLWIDSLCIVQDSEEAWMAESSLMCEVYQHA